MLHTTPDASVALLVNILPPRHVLVEVFDEPRPTSCSQSCITHESETAHVAPLRHALVKLDAAAGRGRQQREIEVADLRVLHRELMEHAVVCLDRRCTAHIL